MENKRNSFGLYDAPVRSDRLPEVSISPKEVEAQLEAGAFYLDRKEAIHCGLIFEHEQQDCVLLDVRGEV